MIINKKLTQGKKNNNCMQRVYQQSSNPPKSKVKRPFCSKKKLFFESGLVIQLASIQVLKMNSGAGGINRRMEPLANWQHLEHSDQVNYVEKCSLKI
jgi:hypothetical protein